MFIDAIQEFVAYHFYLISITLQLFFDLTKFQSFFDRNKRVNELKFSKHIQKTFQFRLGLYFGQATFSFKHVTLSR